MSILYNPEKTSFEFNILAYRGSSGVSTNTETGTGTENPPVQNEQEQDTTSSRNKLWYILAGIGGGILVIGIIAYACK